MKAESFACTINSTSSHIAAKFSAEPWKKTLIVTNYHVCRLNWTNATPFRLCGPSTVCSLLISTSWSVRLELAMWNEILWVEKGLEPFHAGSLCLVSFERFSFLASKLLQVQDIASVDLTCSILSTCGRFCLFWNFDSYMLFLFCSNNDDVIMSSCTNV